MNKSKTSFVGIDLFAGAGGLSLGAEMAGMQVVLAIEQDKYAATTYKVNHPNTKVIIDSIQNIENLEIDVQRESIKLYYLEDHLVKVFHRQTKEPVIKITHRIGCFVNFYEWLT